MNTLRVIDGNLELRMTGLDAFTTLRRKITVPLASVTSVEVEPKGRSTPPLLRAPGTYVPRLVTAGTFKGDGQREFWNVKRAKQNLVVHINDHKYTRLVLGMADAEGKAAEITAAIENR